MLDPVIIATPAIFPHRCALCSEGTGPIADTHVEIPGYGRLYVCPRCAKTYARLYGFAEGSELDAREEAYAERDAAKRAEASALEQLGNEAAENAILTRTVDERDAQIAELAGRLAQMETSIRESAEAAERHLELVGKDAR